MTHVQLAVIGAMQRAHPALTQLWLQWVFPPKTDLWRAAFELDRGTEGFGPQTKIWLKASPYLDDTWQTLGDRLGADPDGHERRQNPVVVTDGSPKHGLFWEAARKREMTEVDGPLEWWWRLAVLRSRGVRNASRRLIPAIFGDEPMLDNALLKLINPSLADFGRRARDIVKNGYTQPTHLHVVLRAPKGSRYEGLSFPLSDDKLKGRFIPAVIDMAVLS